MEEAPEQIHRRFAEAFNRGDLDALCALYEPAGVLVTGRGPVEGVAAIREIYRGVLETHPAIELETLGASRSGTLALLHGKWVMRGTGTDGTRFQREGRNSEVVRRQPDGRWLFVIDRPSAPE